MTQKNPNPNGTSNTNGWSGSGCTIAATADGLRVTASATGTGRYVRLTCDYTPAFNYGWADAFYLSPIMIRRNNSTGGVPTRIRLWNKYGVSTITGAYEENLTTLSGSIMPSGAWITFARGVHLGTLYTDFEKPGYFDLQLPDNSACDLTVKAVRLYDNVNEVPDIAAISGGELTWTLNASTSLTVTAAPPAASVDQAINRVAIDWGDGTAITYGAATATLSHTYAKPINATLRKWVSLNGVTPSSGYPMTGTYGTWTEAASKTSYVPAGSFTAAYTYETDYLNVFVDGASSIAPTNDPVDVYEWDWGDGTAKSYGAQQNHTYAAPGGYPIRLTTKTNESLRTSTVVKTVTVAKAPDPALYFTVNRSLLDVTFSPSIAGATSYLWDFGDGTTDNLQQPTHSYGAPGTYSVTLTVNGTQTTTQVVTVFNSYRKLSRISEALRLEVALPPVAGSVYNRLPNPSGDQGAWAWSTPVVGSYVTASSTTDLPDDHGVPDAKLIYHAAGSSTQQMLSQAVPVTAGQYVGGQVVVPYVEGYYRLTVDALNASGAVVGSSATSGYQQAGTGAVRTTAYLLPTGTATARLRIEFFGNNTGGLLAAGKIGQVRNAMLATAATSAAVTGNPYVSGRQWVDVIGPAVEINTGRTELDVGTMGATVLESGYDPATSGTIRPGQPVRLLAQTEDGSGNQAWQPLFTGTLTGAQVTYNTKRKADDPKSTRIVLSATDPTTLLAQMVQPNGVATLLELPAILETAGVPYEVNGASGQVPSANIVAYNENASVLDQVAITRDTTASFAYVSRAGVLTAVDSAHLDAAVAGVVDEAAYSAVDASFDTGAVINSVTIKWLRYTPASGDSEATTEEITYGPYEDAASIDEWGFQPATFTMQGVEIASTIQTKANAILAANKTPQRRIKTVSVPIRYLEDLTTGKALLDLYDLVQLGYARTGTNAPARVISVSHKITPQRWTMELGFTPDGSVAAPQAVPSPPATIETSAAPAVAMYLTAPWTHNSNANFLAIPFNGTDITGGITWDATAMDLTVPAAGLYLVTGGIWWNASATGNRYMRLMKNGVLSLRTGPLAGSVALQNFLTAVVQCAAGDKLQLQAYQNSGGSLVAAGDSNRPTYVQVAKIG